MSKAKRCTAAFALLAMVAMAPAAFCGDIEAEPPSVIRWILGQIEQIGNWIANLGSEEDQPGLPDMGPAADPAG